MKTLVVGGTGPTGPHILRGLLARGHEVSIFHRGVHEPEDLPKVEHIHGDPHFAESIAAALRTRTFDLVIVTYGRLKLLAHAFAGRCAQFISVGGIPAHLGMLNPGRLRPFGMRIPTREDDDLATGGADDPDMSVRFAHRTWAAERAVIALHEAGAFSATHFRYPRIYGPRQPAPGEWSIVKRILDKRPFFILPDGGLQIDARCAAQNAAHCILLGVDCPDVASGEIYNCVDDELYTWRQITELIADKMQSPLIVLSMPDSLAAPARALTPMATANSHTIIDGGKIRRELGYRDQVAPRTALYELVDWLVAHPIAAENFERDPFSYAAEDRLIAAWRSAIAQIERDTAFAMPAPRHGYDHPATPAKS